MAPLIVLTPQQKQEVADELGDVLINVAHLADKLGIDVMAAAMQKIEKIKARIRLAPQYIV